MNLFRRVRAEPWPLSATYFTIGGVWGQHVDWCTWKETRADGCEYVWGHWRPRPIRGDILTVPMTSGRDKAYRFVEVELCRDPTDMFFAWVAPMGYADEVEMPARKEQGDFV